MGRYDGEEYEQMPVCRPTEHRFAFNGTCHVCRWSKQDLVSNAIRVLENFAPERLA